MLFAWNLAPWPLIMRFIIPELPYERPLLAGRLRYERHGQPTGAVESWRLTDAVDGYRFLRVDLDAREAASGRSWLFHATLDPAGLPEQVKYRFWGDGLEVSGAVVRQGDEWVAARQVNGAAYIGHEDVGHEDVGHEGVGHEDDGREDTARGAAFWFPSGAGLALLAARDGETTGVTLAPPDPSPSKALALIETPVEVIWGDVATVEMGGEILDVRPLSVAWPGNRRVVWLDSAARPLRLWRDDGLTAEAERLVRYSR